MSRSTLRLLLHCPPLRFRRSKRSFRHCWGLGDSHSHFQTLDTREAAQRWCRWLLGGGKRRLSWFLVCGGQTLILHSSFREARYSCTARAAGQNDSTFGWTFSQALRAFIHVSRFASIACVQICFPKIYLKSCLCFSHHTHTGQWGICYCVQFDAFYERIDLTCGTHMMPHLFNDT